MAFNLLFSYVCSRASPITIPSRSAANPINALLNYCYAILKTEVRLAILAIGLNPGMRMLHADLKSRDSFVADIMEPLRPVVDGYVLTLLDERHIAAKEFFDTRQGICWLMPPLPQTLAELAPRLAKLAALVVEQVVQRLAHGQGMGTRACSYYGTSLIRTHRPSMRRPGGS